MRRLSWLLIAALCLASLPAYSYWQSRQQVSIVTCTAYTGPGDIVASARTWVGLRGYNCTYASPGTNPAADVCDAATGATCSTINILSNGTFDVATAAASSACTVACVVKKLYDQTGNGRHFSQATLSLEPVLTFNCLGSLPCLTYTALQKLVCTSCGSYGTQPYSLSVAGQNSLGTDNTIWSDSTFGIGIYSSATTNWNCYSGSGAGTITVIAGHFYGIQCVYNGASSVGRAGGAEATFSTADVATTTTQYLGNNGDNATQNILESGFWSGAFSSGNRSSLGTNQSTYWGY